MQEIANVRESFIKRQLAEEDVAIDEKKMGMVMMMAALGNNHRQA
jgi:hypothetical protein